MGRIGRSARRTTYIARSSPRENGYVQSFNGRLRDDLPRRGDIYDAPRGAGRYR